MLRRVNKKGQNTLEYVLLISAVIGAFIVVQFYLSRGVQGRVRDSADSIGDQFDAGYGSFIYTTKSGGGTTVTLENIKDDNLGPDGIDATDGRATYVSDPEVTLRWGTEEIEKPVTP